MRQIFLDGSDDNIARWIWKNLVPKVGRSQSIQGEVLRAIEKLRWEAQSNGNINGGALHDHYADFIESSLTSVECFSDVEKESIRKDVRRLKIFLSPNDLKDRSQASQLPYIEDDLYDRLGRCLVKFCRQHPILIPFVPPNDAW